MQTRLRAEFDGDRNEDVIGISDYRTDHNTHEILCSECFRPFFADQAAFESISRAIEEGIDNPFLCDDCEAIYDDAEQREH